MYDKETGRPKGFGFAEFADADAAASAVRNLNDYDLMGRKLRVDWSNESGSGDNAPSSRDPNTQAPMGMNGQPAAVPPPAQPSSTLGPLPPGVELPPNLTCPDAISRTLSTLPPDQLLDILSQMKGLVMTDPAKATELLRQAPQLAYAIFQSLLLLQLVDPQILTSLVETSAAPAPVAQAPPVQPVLAQPTQVGSRYGGLAQQPGNAGGLSSLWDNNAVSQPQDAQSLRRGRGAPPPMRQQADARLTPYNRHSDNFGGGREEIAARPLPSQRAGSYQNAGLGGGRDNTPPAPSGGSAQNRLRQRFMGGTRTASPSGSSPFAPPAQPAQQQSGGPRGGYNNSSGGGDYEDRFAPGGMYDSNSGSRGGGSDRPFMAANSPWATSEDEFFGGGGGGGGGGDGGRAGGGRRQGLPSGPRMR